MSDSIKGVDVARVTAWFEANVAGATGPLTFDLIAGGHSNLTFGVTDADGQPLRAAPPAARPRARHRPRHGPRAQDHLRPRAHRRAGRARPRPLHRRGGERRAVLRHGLRRRARPPRRAPPPTSITAEAARATRATRSPTRWPRSTPSTPTPSASATSARRRTTSPRQLKRWYGQWEKSKTRELPLVDEVHDALLARIPEQGPAAIVHGDYRLDNCMTDDDGNVIAVLDWEICTLGDPLADVGLLMVYWTEADDAHPMLLTAPTAQEGFLARKEVLDRYAEQSGRDLSPDRLLHRLRLLEAGLHRRGRVRPLRRRRHGQHRPEGVRGLQGAGRALRRAGRRGHGPARMRAADR